MRINRNRVTVLSVFLAGILLLGLAAGPVRAAGGREAIRTNTALDTLETARFFLKQARYARAVFYYDIILTRFKDNDREAAWALYEKSYCFYKMRKYKLALAGFKSIGQLYPDETGPISLGEIMTGKIELKYGKDIQ